MRAHREDREVSLSLATLLATTRRADASAPVEIGRFVAAVAPRLAAATAVPAGAENPVPDPAALLWCVRAERDVRAHGRARELVVRELPAGLCAFVAEALPGEVMQGVSGPAAARAGVSEPTLRACADENTAARFQGWVDTLARAPSTSPWRFGGDVLFTSSLLLAPAFLRAVADRGGGSARLAAPARALVLAGPGADPDGARFAREARRVYRTTPNPISPAVLRTDGLTLVAEPAAAPGTRRRWWPW